MKKSYFFIPAAALLTLAACNKMESVETPELGGQTIQLTLDASRGDADTKTTMSYNDNYGSLESVWASGDVVYVYSKKSGDQIGTLTIVAESITNTDGGSVSAYATSKASFKGSVTLGSGDTIKDDFAFVYQGTGRSLAVSGGFLTYEMGTSATPEGLSAWDVAYGTGKIQGSAAKASCSVSFGNRVAFGYFSTEGLDGLLNGQYIEAFTLDVKTGTIAGINGEVELLKADEKGHAFYMPLVPGTVNINCGRQWKDDNTYTEITQSISFTAAAGSYYRLGRNAVKEDGETSNAFGPVTFKKSDEITFNTMRDKTFKISNEKSVYFTPGNLQYIGSKSGSEHWQLAPSQYSYLGTSNAKPANAEKGVTFTGDLDLFGWGEVSAPFHGSTDNSDYLGGYVSAAANQVLTDDHNWATKFNSVTELYQDYSKDKKYVKQGTDYLVLSPTEWKYIFDNHYWGYATVVLTNGSKVNGVAVLPSNIDKEKLAAAIIPNWRKSSGNVYHSTNTSNANRFTENEINQAVLDTAGALFLPAAGYRNGSSINDVGSFGYYWSTTSQSASNAYGVYFNGSYFGAQNYNCRYYGFSVRLAVASE